MPAAGAMRLKWMLNPCAKRSSAPGLMFGAISASYIFFCAVSGAAIMITSARFAASATVTTSKPSAVATGRLFDPSASATITFSPDSLRFFACACPWLP